MFKGSLVALVTPMEINGNIAWSAFDELIEWHIQAGTQGIIIAGSTGESATLSLSEKIQLMQRAVAVSNKRIPIIAGVGAPATDVTIALAKSAIQAGVDGLLIVTPSYNRPPQRGLIAHFSEIAKVCPIPILLYNVPSRTACDLLPETILKLRAFKNIIGIKDATGKLDRLLQIKKICGEDFVVLSGDDATVSEWMDHGADGVISVTANIAPELMRQLMDAHANQDRKKITELNTRLHAFHAKQGVESNPIPAKWALARMGKIPSGIRLPLMPLAEQFHVEIENILSDLGVLCDEKV